MWRGSCGASLWVALQWYTMTLRCTIAVVHNGLAATFAILESRMPHPEPENSTVVPPPIGPAGGWTPPITTVVRSTKYQ